MTARIFQKIAFNLAIWGCGLLFAASLIPWLIHRFSPGAKIDPLSFASFADTKLLTVQIGGAVIAIIYVFILEAVNPAPPIAAPNAPNPGLPAAGPAIGAGTVAAGGAATSPVAVTPIAGTPALPAAGTVIGGGPAAAVGPAVPMAAAVPAAAPPPTAQDIFLGELQSTFINFGSLSCLVVFVDGELSYGLSSVICYFAAWVLRKY